MTPSLTWTEASLDELSARALHDLLKLRVDVFVVEQRCAYAEIDGQDALSGTRHIFATESTNEAQGAVVAAARVLAPDAGGPVRIGRVVVKRSYRGTGLSKQLMDRAMQHCAANYQTSNIELSAQVGADALYLAYGFEVVSADYLDDGILHRDMRRGP